MLRCVACTTIQLEHLKDNKPNPELYELSKRALIGCVDGFLSHSWSDDANEKFEATAKIVPKIIPWFGRVPF